MARSHRRGVLGIYDAAFRRADGDWLQAAEIVRQVGIERRAQGESGIGVGIVQYHVDAVRAGSGRACEVDMDRAFIDVDGHRAFQQDFLAPRNVEPTFTVIRTAFQLADRIPCRGLRPGDDFFRQLVDVVQAVAVAQKLHPLRADPARRHLRRQVAEHLVWCAHVVAHHVEQQFVRLSRLVKLGARYP